LVAPKDIANILPSDARFVVGLDIFMRTVLWRHNTILDRHNYFPGNVYLLRGSTLKPSNII